MDWPHRCAAQPARGPDATHLTGAFLRSKHALQSEPHIEAYAATKGGLAALTHALAISAGPAVRVDAIVPGWIVTDNGRKPAPRRSPKPRRQDHAQHPAGRVGTPQDIGDLSVYLLSAQSGFITG